MEVKVAPLSAPKGGQRVVPSLLDARRYLNWDNPLEEPRGLRVAR